MGTVWRKRDARQFVLPDGYVITWPDGDPLASAPEIQRYAVSIGWAGLFRRLDLGDLAAGRCLLHVIANGLAKWPASATAKRHGRDSVPTQIAVRALENLIGELHLAPDRAADVDLRGQSEPFLDSDRLIDDFCRGLLFLVRKANRLVRAEDFDVADDRQRESASLAHDTATAERTAAVRQAVDVQFTRLHAVLTALNDRWLPTGEPYRLADMARVVTEAARCALGNGAEALVAWLDPKRLEIRTACYLLRHVGRLTGRQAQERLMASGYRSREGRPYPYNSIPSYASQARKAVNERLTVAHAAAEVL